MKNLKNYLTGNAVHLALASLVWAFPGVTDTFSKPQTFLWVLLIISPLAAAGIGWVVNMAQSVFKKETPNGADVKRTVYGSLIPIVPVALIGFGWYLPAGFAISLIAAIIIHFKK